MSHCVTYLSLLCGFCLCGCGADDPGVTALLA